MTDWKTFCEQLHNINLMAFSTLKKAKEIKRKRVLKAKINVPDESKYKKGVDPY